MLCVILILIAVSSILYTLIQRRKPREKIAGVYTQPGPWYRVKYLVACTILWSRYLKSKLFPNAEVVHMETIQSLSTDKNAFDAVFFQASSQIGISFCGGIERHHEGKAQVLMYLLLPDVGLLESENLPRTIVDADLVQLLNFRSFSAGGIHFTPIEPMKKWHLHYKGRMRVLRKPGKVHEVELEGFFTNEEGTYYLLERDLDPFCMAKALAKEGWSEQYFETLEKHHQDHYEQMGNFAGTLTIDGEVQLLAMRSYRDHSYGHQRDWSLIHRYVYHVLHLQDGTSISFGVACRPCTISALITGHVASGKLMYPIQDTDFLLHEHAEDGNPEKEYSFSFSTRLGKHNVSIWVVQEAWHYRGAQEEAKILQRFVNCQVNGIKGRGLSEWHYNNTTK